VVSETSHARDRLAPYCEGMGLDIGFGGDPIVPHAVTMDLQAPYTQVGDAPQNLWGDCQNLYWFRDGVLDWVYSSHLIEDFSYERQRFLIHEWLRVVKIGGVVVLYAPDEQVYREHCERSGQPHNDGHKEADFSCVSFKERVLPGLAAEVVHENPHVDAYSWEVVLRRTRQ